MKPTSEHESYQSNSAAQAESGAKTRTTFPAVLVGAVILAMFMAVLDQTIVGTALPQIAQDIDGAHLYTWIVTSYLLTSTVFVPIFGTLSDRFGHKKLLIMGIVVFAAASVACGLAGDATVLVAARAVQGLGAAVLVTVPLALMLDRTPADKAVQIQSAFGAIIAVSLLIGPYLGGLLTDHLSWHWVFFINVPIAALVLFVVVRTLHETPRQRTGPLAIDWSGFLVFTISICLLLVGLSNKNGETSDSTRSWHNTSVWPYIVIGVLGIIVFVIIEWHVSNPIIPVRKLRAGRFTPTIIASLAVAFLMYPAIIFMPRYFQSALGSSATSSALHAFPLMLGLVAGMVALGVIVKSTGLYRAPLIASGLIALAGLWLMKDLSLQSTPQIYFGLALIGIGIGPMISGLMMVAQQSLDQSDVGLATSTVTFFRQIGGTVSLAFAGGIFASNIHSSVTTTTSVNEAVPHAVSSVIIPLGFIGAIVVIICTIFLPSVDLRGRPIPTEENPQ